MIDLGDRRAGVILHFPFNTHAIAGESITLATNGTVKVYKNGVTTTEVTTGATLSEDVDSMTGAHFVIVDTSADGTFYAEGNDFQVMLQAATIDGKTINAWIGSFSLANRAGLMPTTAARKLDVSAGGEAGLDWANIGSPTTANNLSSTNIDADQVVASVTAGVTLGAGAVSAAAIATGAIDADALATDAVTEIVDAIVAAVADSDELAAAIWNYLAATATTVGSLGKLIVDNLNATLSSRASQASLDTVDDFLDTEIAAILAAVDTEVAAIKVKTDQMVFTTANRVDSQVFGMQASVLTAAAIATDAITAAKIAADAIGASELAADAVTEIKTGLSTLDAAGVRAAIGMALANLDTQLAAILANVDTEIAAILAAVDTEVAAIKAKTDQLIFSTANRVDVQVFGMEGGVVTANAIASNAIGAAELAADAVTEIQAGLATAAALVTLQTTADAIPTEAELATALATADDAVLARLGTPAGASIAADLAAIEAQTDDIGPLGAFLSAVPWNAAWDVQVESEVTDALNAYDPPTRAEATSDANSVLARLPAALTGAGNIKADLLALNDDSGAVTLLVSALNSEHIGTVAAGTLTSVAFTTNLTDVAANTWRRSSIVFLGGVLENQRRVVTAYDEATFLITVDEAFSAAPGIGDQFQLI